MRFRVTIVATALLLSACADSGGDQATASDEPGSDPVEEPDVPRADIDPDAPTAELATGFNNAGFELLRAQPQDENVVFSPSSIGNALLMARAAADPTTAAAIDDTFGLPDGAHEAWNAIDQAMAAANGEDLTITVADRIWPRHDVEPDPDWIELLTTHHGAGVEPLDLGGDPDGSRERINGWVDDRTEGLIPELLPSGFINGNTVLVLTDALYYKARWATPFGKYGPVDGTFTRLDGSTAPVQFMQELELSDKRGQGDGYVAAELPYAGGEFAMLVIVPDEGRFAEFRDQLSQDFVARVDQALTTGPYELLLPPWETTTQIDLLGWLTDQGAAPGSYPAISPGAFLSGAVHGSDIAVDEWGTVAAAATGLGFDESGPPEPELVIAADQPFLYLIRHRDSGLVLFAGQVTDPTA